MGVSFDSGGGGNADMAIAFEGGPKFTDRLNQLAEARAQHDAALAALQEGQQVKVTLAEAQDRDAKSKAEAEQRVAAAKAEVDEILASARATAKAMREQATSEREALTQELAKLRSDHDAYIASSRAEADRLMTQAAADAEAASRSLAETATAREQIAGLQQAATQAKADADAARTAYEAARARLMMAISEAAAIAGNATS